MSLLVWSMKDLRECVEKMVLNKFDCIMFIEGKRGLGKCLSYHTTLKQHDNKTLINPTKKIGKFKDGELINTVSWDFKNNKYVLSKSKVLNESENKELFKVKLANGKEIICSMEHKLFIKRNHKVTELRLKNIKKGDELICLP